jgi:hypothetical protein
MAQREEDALSFECVHSRTVMSGSEQATGCEKIRGALREG